MMQDKVTLVCQGSEKPATSCEEELDSLPEGGIAGTEFEKGMTSGKYEWCLRGIYSRDDNDWKTDY